MIIMEEKPWKTAYVFGMTCFFFKKKIHSSSSNYQQKYFCVLTCALLVNKTTRSLAKKKKKNRERGRGDFYTSAQSYFDNPMLYFRRL